MSNQFSTRRAIALGAALATLASGAVLVAVPAQAVSPDIRITEVYGGGGNTGAPWEHDFIELYNVSAAPVDVSTWSVQYASAGGTTWTNKTNLVGTIDPGEVYLIQEGGTAGGTGEPLPPPDATGSILMSATAGKVALVTNQTALGCAADCDTAAGVLDFVGYGSANDSETAAAPTLSNTTSATRDSDAADTDNNSVDFTVASPPHPDELPEGDPEPTPLTIAEIQGVGHLSNDEGVLAETTGITTAVSTNGYWIQDPTGDGNPVTSEGIFVFTGSGGDKPDVGDAVTVTGTVDEFRPGSASGPGLNITEITGSSFETTSTGNPLPAATVIGVDGVQAPADIIDNDSPTRIDIEVVPPASYDPAEDAIDFYEQYEGMLLQLNDPVAVGPTNSFGEIVVKPRGPSGYVRSPNGGVVYTSYDSPNPRRLILDDVILGAGNMPLVNTGDDLSGAIVGPLDYGFNNWRMYPTAVPTVVPGDAARSSAQPAGAKQLAVATFNVENLDPTDPQSKFDDLAEIVVDNLAAPDIVALEEVQDNNGAVNDSVVDASATLDQFVAAISAAGGPAYEWTQINPVDDQDGGEPGGNIRVAFIYRTDRGLTFVQRGDESSTEPTEATVIEGELAITRSPGRVNPQDAAAWDATRKPLAAEFEWRGEKLFVIANHFSSKGGDEPLFGRWQPPARSSETKRHLQAASVNEFVEELLAIDPDANIAVVGDINDFEFSTTIDILTDSGADLADLIQYLKPKQRYTYVFEGNSQVLDHILVGPSLAPVLPEGKPVRPRKDYEIVHVNADFHDQVSDHDTQVVRLRFGSGSP